MEKEFLKLFRGSFKVAQITANSTINKLDIVEQKKSALDREYQQNGWTKDLRYEHMRWSDLRTTIKWVANHTGRGSGNWQANMVAHGKYIYKMVTGEDIEVDVPKHFRSPSSFRKEPCDKCKNLENEFIENDSMLRNETNPWKIQYYNLLNAIVSDAYRSLGGFHYYATEIKKLYPKLKGGRTSTGEKWEDVIVSYRIGLEKSRLIFFQGRACFLYTDASAFNQFNEVPKEKRDKTIFRIVRKYLDLGERHMKCKGGLFVLDENKLCKSCKANLEPDPVEIRDDYRF